MLTDFVFLICNIILMDENYDIVKKLCGKRMRIHSFRLQSMVCLSVDCHISCRRFFCFIYSTSLASVISVFSFSLVLKAKNDKRQFAVGSVTFYRSEVGESHTVELAQ